MVKVFKSYNAPNIDGTSLKGYINTTYKKLVSLLGEPTYNEPSSDNKVQVEWIVEYKGEVFTIYDWKTFSREYTENQLGRFHVGGKQYSGGFQDYINQGLDN